MRLPILQGKMDIRDSIYSLLLPEELDNVENPINNEKTSNLKKSSIISAQIFYLFN